MKEINIIFTNFFAVIWSFQFVDFFSVRALISHLVIIFYNAFFLIKNLAIAGTAQANVHLFSIEAVVIFLHLFIFVIIIVLIIFVTHLFVFEKGALLFNKKGNLIFNVVVFFVGVCIICDLSLLIFKGVFIFDKAVFPINAEIIYEVLFNIFFVICCIFFFIAVLLLNIAFILSLLSIGFFWFAIFVMFTGRAKKGEDILCGLAIRCLELVDYIFKLILKLMNIWLYILAWLFALVSPLGGLGIISRGYSRDLIRYSPWVDQWQHKRVLQRLNKFDEKEFEKYLRATRTSFFGWSQFKIFVYIFVVVLLFLFMHWSLPHIGTRL